MRREVKAETMAAHKLRYKVRLYPLDRVGEAHSVQVGNPAYTFARAIRLAARQARENVPRADVYELAVEVGTPPPAGFNVSDWEEVDVIPLTRTQLFTVKLKREKTK